MVFSMDQNSILNYKKNQIYYSEQFPCLKLANNKRELWLRKLSEILEILMNMAGQSYLPTLQVIVCRLF